MVYGYGIVDKDGNAFWEEGCVCADRLHLEDTVCYLNEAPDQFAPYRVVQLTFRCKG